MQMDVPRIDAAPPMARQDLRVGFTPLASSGPPAEVVIADKHPVGFSAAQDDDLVDLGAG
jgi:hypothetical protein